MWETIVICSINMYKYYVKRKKEKGKKIKMYVGYTLWHMLVIPALWSSRLSGAIEQHPVKQSEEGWR